MNTVELAVHPSPERAGGNARKRLGSVARTIVEERRFRKMAHAFTHGR